jgi:hypothetical protein
MLARVLQHLHSIGVASLNFLDESVRWRAWQIVVSGFHVEAADLLTYRGLGPRAVKKLNGLISSVEQWMLLRIALLKAICTHRCPRLAAEAYDEYVWLIGICCWRQMHCDIGDAALAYPFNQLLHGVEMHSRLDLHEQHLLKRPWLRVGCPKELVRHVKSLHHGYMHHQTTPPAT